MFFFEKDALSSYLLVFNDIWPSKEDCPLYLVDPLLFLFSLLLCVFDSAMESKEDVERVESHLKTGGEIKEFKNRVSASSIAPHVCFFFLSFFVAFSFLCVCHK